MTRHRAKAKSVVTAEVARPVLTRLPDWQARLSDYLAASHSAAFVPGTLDCALFAAGAIEAQTGVDLAADWRGYATLEDGLNGLIKAGFDDHIALCAALLDEVPIGQARPGDIAVLSLGRNLASLGLVQGEFAYVLIEDAAQGRCLHLVPLSLASRAFRVPR